MKHVGDPRLQAKLGAIDPRDAGIRLAVRLPRKQVPMTLIVFGALIGGLLLVVLLNAGRVAESDPSISALNPESTAPAWQAPPPLELSGLRAIGTQSAPSFASAQSYPSPQPVFRPLANSAAPIMRPSWSAGDYGPPPGQALTTMMPPLARSSAGSPLVIDVGQMAADTSSPQREAEPVRSSGRVRASAFANPATTVPQGSMIPAVIETGFDSTSPGFARAIVSRDVRGFDGTQVIIPRGSRLLGAYRGQAVRGQNRAVILWTRLIRPDGMTIALDSPAVDELGRGGLAASVNTHFFARLGDAFLQSVVQLGSVVGSRASSGSVMDLPNDATALAGQPVKGYAPTLTLRPGMSVSVFVAHDLDFGSTQVAP